MAKQKKTKSKKKRDKKQKKKRIIGIVGAATGGSLLIFALFFTIGYFVSHRQEESPFDYSSFTVQKPETEKMLLTKNPNSRPGTELSQVNGVVIHYTANPNTDAKANRDYFESRKDCPDESAYKVSSHYIIGLSGNIIQCIPEKEIAYASNERNLDTISIECCYRQESGQFEDETYQALVALTAYLCAKYELDVTSVIRHYDVTGKNCPKYYVENPSAWDNFLSDVTAYLTQEWQKQVNS